MNFPVLKGLNKIKKKKIKNHLKPSKLVSQSLLNKFQQKRNIFLVFHGNFNPFTPCTPLGGF